MSTLSGGKELRARLKAMKLAFKPIGSRWADDTAALARPMVPSKTGKLRASIRRKNATQRRATVAANYTAFFIDKGTVAHAVTPKKAGSLVFTGRHGTIFAKRVRLPAKGARPFRARAARAALRRHPMSAELIAQWNAAA